MIDFIVLVAPIEPSYDYHSNNPFKLNELDFYPEFKNGILKGFKSEYKGLRVLLYHDKIQLSNSLHKFYKGNNYSDFRYSELKEAILEICRKFKIKAEHWEIIKMEFGFNILTTKKAKQYIDLFLEYKGRDFENMKDHQTNYGKKCYMYEYSLKIYDKYFQTQKSNDKGMISDKMLRAEFCYNQKRKLPKQIKTLSDLLDKEKFKELYRDFIKAFEKVIYNDDVDFFNSTFDERQLFHASLNPSFLKVEQQYNKKELKAIKSKIKQLREKFLKKEFKAWFLNALNMKYIDLYCS